MKKVFTLILTVALVLSLGVTSVFAASQPQGANYADENGDGVCDACGFSDTNGDGICDSCPSGGVRPQDGTGAQRGRMGGRNQ